VKKFKNHTDFPVYIILFVLIIIGSLIFHEFGASWDEPEYYQYAESTFRAYSIREILNGNYDYTNTLGTNDLRYYGPAFLIIGKVIHSLISIVFPNILSIDMWHLITYLSFLLGVYFFYKLATRWVTISSAVVATILFVSQPVIFGMAWINPKDTPFMTFFMGSLFFGLIFSDDVRKYFKKQDINKIDTTINKKEKTKGQEITLALLIIFGAFYFFLILFFNHLKSWVYQTILTLDINNPINQIQKIVINHSDQLTQENVYLYANKAEILIKNGFEIFSIIAIFCFIITISYYKNTLFLSAFIFQTRNFCQDFYARYMLLPNKRKALLSLIGASVFLALSCATRVIGPFVALLVIFVWINTLRKYSVIWIGMYCILSFVIFLLFWPYLWKDTISNLVGVIKHMSSNPVVVNVLFNSGVYSSHSLPPNYLPVLLISTLTIPTIFLFIFGLAYMIIRYLKIHESRSELIVLFTWFWVIILYVVVLNPPMYDNYRHFLFITPAIFLISAFAIQLIFDYLKFPVLKILLIVIILIPGFFSLVQLHPYQYSYYNKFVGGFSGAENRFELDYWLTCYKSITKQINIGENQPVNVYVDQKPDLVGLYADPNITVMKLDNIKYPEGSLIILPIRWDHKSLFPDFQIEYSVSVDDVEICIARRVN